MMMMMMMMMIIIIIIAKIIPPPPMKHVSICKEKVTCKKLSKYFSSVQFLHSVKENPTVVRNIPFLDVTHFQMYAYNTKNYMRTIAPKITATPDATHSMRAHFSFRNDMGTTIFNL